MSDAAIVCTVLTAGVELLLMAFAVFCIGFFTGYRREDNKLLRKQNKTQENQDENSEEQIKRLKKWKNFINYDGSSKTDNMP